MTWVVIPDSDIDPDSPITTGLMTALRDNFAAMAAGDSGAPTIVYAAMSFSNNIVAGDIAANAIGASEIAPDAIGASEIATNGVGQAEIAANAVGQSELKDTTGEVSTTIDNIAILTLPGGSYGFYPQIKQANTIYPMYAYINEGAISTTGYLTRISLRRDPGGTNTVYAQQRYFTASRPYDLGDGEVGRFIFALIDNTTGKVESVYQAQEAPWHYNGKTDVRGKLFKLGDFLAKYRVRKDMNSVPFTYDSIKNDPVKLAEYVDAFNLAPTYHEEITQELYQRDMSDISHPFMGNDLTGKTVVMLDPVSDLNHKLSEMCNYYDEFDLNGLLHDGHLVVSNTGLDRFGPQGILIPSFKWKNTK